MDAIRLPIHIFDTAADLGASVAAEIADEIEAATLSGRRFVLGCPGGRSPRDVYRGLARAVAERGLDLRDVWIAMMDDYVVPFGGGYRRVSPTEHYSCERFARVEILGQLNDAAGAGRGIPDEHLLLPDPSRPKDFEKQLDDLGGVDHFLLASGAGDGHVAFNPPGSELGSTTRVVELNEQTRIDNLGTFPDFASLDEVPRHGVTVGVETIVRVSRRASMIITGQHKAMAFKTITSATSYEANWPATVVVLCKSAQILADRAAAGAWSA